MERSLSIGQLASATGLAARTIRYYERVGVLPAPRRSASGYRQYERRDVHRALFIRRVRALGLPLSSLRTLTADLNRRPFRMIHPRLQQVVTEHLRAVREQMGDLRVLEQQLEQILERLRTIPSGKRAEACECLEAAATLTPPQTSGRPSRRTREGPGMSSHSTLEAMTRFAVTSNGDCDCGCSCESFGVLSAEKPELIPPPRAAEPPNEEAGRRPRPDRAVDSRGRRS